MTRYIFSSQFVKGKVVLDIACGSGYGTDYLLKVGAVKVIGVDISDEAISYCKDKYSRSGMEFLVGSVEKIPVESNSIDIIVSFETIEHVIKTSLFNPIFTRGKAGFETRWDIRCLNAEFVSIS